MSAERKSIEFIENTPNDLDEQRAAFIEAARIEVFAEKDIELQAVREPISRRILDGHAVGPVLLKKTGPNQIEATPQGEFYLDGSELAVGKKVKIYTPKRELLDSLQITEISRSRILLKSGSKQMETPAGPIFLVREAPSMANTVYTRLKTPAPAWPPQNMASLEIEPTPTEAKHEGGNFQDCLSLCLGENKLTGIKGPPGTGKTWLLAWSACLLAKKGKSVIVSSNSHAAVETAMLKIADVGAKITPGLKLGKKAASGQKSLPEELLDAGIAPITTLADANLFVSHQIVGVVNTSYLASQDVPKADFMLLDEAGQISAFTACALATAATNMVLFGDENQLNPILIGEHHDRLECAHSAMAFLRKRFPDRTKTLLVNHRSNKKSVAFTQKNYYEKILLEAGRNKESRIEETEIEVLGNPMKLPGQGTHVINVFHSNRKNHAPEESQMTLKIIESLLGKTLYLPEETRKLEGRDFAVLCPNKRQAEHVRRTLERNLPPESEIPDCGTVHKLQGQGRPVVIFCTTASHTGYMEKQAEFLFSTALWNVATSRAVAVTYILGNQDAITNAAPKTLAGLELKAQVAAALKGNQIAQSK